MRNEMKLGEGEMVQNQNPTRVLCQTDGLFHGHVPMFNWNLGPGAARHSDALLSSPVAIYSAKCSILQ